jgi:cytidylate kinase
MFRQRHGFDLFEDRHRYDAVLCNSHLIPVATTAAANVGIETFAPVVYGSVVTVMTCDESAARTLQQHNGREVRRVTVWSRTPSPADVS